MAKFIKAQDIPEDMNALAFWTDSDGNTEYQMSKTLRGAKIVKSRHTDNPVYGWMTIEPHDRENGIMVW